MLEVRRALILLTTLAAGCVALPPPPPLVPYKASAALHDPTLELSSPLHLYSVTLDDIKTLSPHHTIIPDLGRYLTSQQRQVVNGETRKLLRIANTKLLPGTGILMRVRLFSNGITHPKPSTDFLIPLGVGEDPLDAYAEHLNLVATRSAPPPQGLVDVGYFVWLSKEEDEIFLIGILPREQDTAFRRAASLLADRKVELRQAGRTFKTYQIPDYAARALFWNERLEQAERSFGSEQRRAAVQALVERFEQLQREHTALLQMEAERSRRKRNGGGFLATAGSVLQIGKQVVANWPKIEAFFDPAPIKRDQTAMDAEVASLKGRALKRGDDLRDVERQLQAIPELNAAS